MPGRVKRNRRADERESSAAGSCKGLMCETKVQVPGDTNDGHSLDGSLELKSVSGIVLKRVQAKDSYTLDGGKRQGSCRERAPFCMGLSATGGHRPGAHASAPLEYDGATYCTASTAEKRRAREETRNYFAMARIGWKTPHACPLWQFDGKSRVRYCTVADSTRSERREAA